MAWYRLVVVNEDARPVQGVIVEAVDLTDRAISATETTNRSGEVLFTALVGPHFFRPRLRRTSGTVGGKHFTGKVEVQVVGMDALCYDFVVDSDGGGNKTTLAAAVSASITAGGDRTIWLCGDISEATIDIGGLGGGSRLIIMASNRTSVTITAAISSDIFKQTTNGGNNGGGLEFHNVGFSIPSSNRAILSIEAGLEVQEVIFEVCRFDNQFLIRQAGSTSMGSLTLSVIDCIGDLEGFYQVGGISPTFAPNILNAFDNNLVLENWWDGGSGNAAPDDTRIQGGHYGLGISSGITFASGESQQHFQDLTITFNAGNALFTTGVNSASIEDLSFQNIVIRFGAAGGTFGDFGALNSSNSGLFIKNIFGYPGAGITPSGTFLTVDSDYTDVHIGNLLAKGFSTTYSGPSGVGDDHGLLTGLGDDDHSQYVLDSDIQSVDFLVGTASAYLSGEIVVGTTPGGELGNTWASPTVDATHSGSAHHDQAHTLSSHSSLDHDVLSGLGDDDHTIYALLAGRGTGQTLIGGVNASNDLTLQSTAHATRGSIFLGTSSLFELVETTGRLKIPTVGINAGLEIGGDVLLYRSGANMLYTPDSMTIAVGLLVDTITEFTPTAGVTIEGTRLEDNDIYTTDLFGRDRGHEGIGYGNLINLTYTGGLQTDISRVIATEGDGRTPLPDSSVGVWEATTNLVTNGGFETNDTGWVDSGATVTRVTTQAKFGSAAGQAVTANAAANEGGYHAFSGAASTVYTCSAWVRGTGTVRIALHDDVTGKQASSTFTLTPVWQRITVTATTGSGSVTFRVYVETNTQQSITFNVDGVQVEAQPLATPYVETDGGTSSRSNCRVQIASSIMDETQGWVVIRMRPGWTSGNAPFGFPTLWEWGDDASNRVLIFYVASSNTFTFQRRDGAGQATNTLVHAMTDGVPLTYVARWTATQIAQSINNSTFSNTSSTNIPSLSSPNIELLTAVGSGNFFDSDILWVAMGTGVLTDADVETFHLMGDNDPPADLFPVSANLTFLWSARTRSSEPAVILQDPDVFIVDPVTKKVTISGTLEVGTVQTYAASNVNTDRTYDADATTVDELADTLGTLIADLRAIGLIN